MNNNPPILINQRSVTIQATRVFQVRLAFPHPEVRKLPAQLRSPETPGTAKWSGS